MTQRALRLRPSLAALLALAAGGCRAPARPAAATAAAAAWARVGEGITCGVSGLAPAGDGGRLLLVHDNKAAGEPRVAVLAFRDAGDAGGAYRAVGWSYDAALRARHAAALGAAPDSLPIDLEAVAGVPGRGDAFLALTSRGTVYRFVLTTTAAGDAAVVDAVFAARPVAAPGAPPDSANYEGFVALPRADGAVLGVWADRGAGARPGVLHWGVLDGAGGVVHTRVLDAVRVPWPTAPEVRHLSDLALSGDALLATAASDPGDAGPFASAVYHLGTLTIDGGAPRLRRAAALRPLLRLGGSKAEAVAVLPAGGGAGVRVAVGSDDELAGGTVVRAGLSMDAAADEVPGASAAATSLGACRAPAGATRRP